MVKLPAHVAAALNQLGVDPSLLENDDGQPRVVVVKASLDDAREALKDAQRDQVVMTRVDAATAAALDDWVKVGAAKSRSEAAALFLREGLNLRADDLKRLSDALAAYEEAKARLQRESDAILRRDRSND